MRRYQIVLSITLLIIITFVSFSNSLNNGFTNWDDPAYVTENPLIKDLSWENLKVIFTSFYREFFSQPLVLLSFSLEYHFFQLDPFIYHLTNLILHILNSLLVFCLISMLSNKVSISLIAALLFGVHPLHVESVAWITERKDVLSTFFFLQALICYLIYRRRRETFYYGLSLLTFFLSLLSKAMVVTLPVVLLLFDYLSYRRFDKVVILEKVPYFVLSGMFGVIALFLHQADSAMVSMSFASFIEDFLVACRNIIFYLTKTFAPFNLSAIYTYPEVVSVLLPDYSLAVLLVIVLMIVVFYTKRWTRSIVFGGVFFVVTILPVLRLIPFPGGGAVVADRYMYIPSIGLFYMVGLAFHRVYNWGGAFERAIRISSTLFLGVVILTFSILTYQRNKVWQDSETLWTDTVKKSPDSLLVHNNLGLAYAEKGLWDQAIAEYKEAIRINPAVADPHNNLGLAYAGKGLWDQAIAEYKKVLEEINPYLVEPHNNLGFAYAEKGLLDQAIAEYKRTLEIKADFVDAHNNLGNVYSRKGQWDEAIAEYREVIKINPDLAEPHNNLGVVLAYAKGQWDEAIVEYKTALRINPDYAMAHNNLGLAYAESGLWNQAILEYKEALRISSDFEEAKENLKRAMHLKESQRRRR